MTSRCGPPAWEWPGRMCRSPWTRTAPTGGPSTSPRCARWTTPTCCTSSSRSPPTSSRGMRASRTRSRRRCASMKPCETLGLHARSWRSTARWSGTSTCIGAAGSRKRPKSEAPLKDLPLRAAQRFKRAREGMRALRHVTEQVVFMGTAWKWVWMYEVGGRKLGYLHPMETGLSGTFILSESEERELAETDGLPRATRQAVRDGRIASGVRWCWMEFPDFDAVDAFVHIIQLKRSEERRVG